MNLNKVYYDLDGNAKTILQMVKLYPEWAANRIQEGEKTIIASPFEIPASSGLIAGETKYLIPIWSVEASVVSNEETPLKVMRIKRVDTSITAKTDGS